MGRVYEPTIDRTSHSTVVACHLCSFRCVRRRDIDAITEWENHYRSDHPLGLTRSTARQFHRPRRIRDLRKIRQKKKQRAGKS